MRHAALITTVCLAATLAGRAQSPTAFVGTLEPELAPGRLATSLALSPAADDARAKIAALLSPDEKLWMGELAVGAAKQPLYLIEAGGEGRAVVTDLNGNGAYEPNERIALTKADEPGVALAATIRVATKGAAFPNFPTRVGLSKAAIAPKPAAAPRRRSSI